MKQIRELQRLLGKKTVEVEVLREAVEYGRAKKLIALAIAAGGRPLKTVCEVLGVSRSNLAVKLTRPADWVDQREKPALDDVSLAASFESSSPSCQRMATGVHGRCRGEDGTRCANREGLYTKSTFCFFSMCYLYPDPSKLRSVACSFLPVSARRHIRPLAFASRAPPFRCRSCSLYAAGVASRYAVEVDTQNLWLVPPPRDHVIHLAADRRNHRVGKSTSTILGKSRRH